MDDAYVVSFRSRVIWRHCAVGTAVVFFLNYVDIILVQCKSGSSDCRGVQGEPDKVLRCWAPHRATQTSYVSKPTRHQVNTTNYWRCDPTFPTCQARDFTTHANLHLRVVHHFRARCQHLNSFLLLDGHRRQFGDAASQMGGMGFEERYENVSRTVLAI